MTDKEAIENLKGQIECHKCETGIDCEKCRPNWSKENDIEALNKGIKSLENQKIGRWIRKNDICTSRVQLYQFECSNCREINTFRSNYCPYCGAKMKGE